MGSADSGGIGGLQPLWGLKNFGSWIPRGSELGIDTRQGPQLLVTTKCVAVGMIRFSFLKTQLWLLLLMDLKKTRVVGGRGAG